MVLLRMSTHKYGDQAAPFSYPNWKCSPLFFVRPAGEGSFPSPRCPLRKHPASTISINRRVYPLYATLLFSRESKAEFMTASVFGDIIYENWLFDMPKLFDIAAL
jgi:hypothetical protein